MLQRRQDNLEFQGLKIREGNHKPFSHSGVCWGNNRCSCIYFSIGISLSGPRS
jgi:hypothetical protein